jgi:1-deoxy-D-xylulose-5-phosphate synthase
MRWAKPLDTELLLKIAASHEALVTVEEGAIMGGAGSAVSEALQAAGVAKPVLHLGLKDQFIEHGDPPNCWPCKAWMPPASKRRHRAFRRAARVRQAGNKPTLKSVA